MTRQQLMAKAREIGSAPLARLLGVDEIVVSRWLSGGVNAQLETLVRAHLPE